MRAVSTLLTSVLPRRRSGTEPFIQRAEIRAWSVTVDYKPRRVDVVALRQGAFVEVPSWRQPTRPSMNSLRAALQCPTCIIGAGHAAENDEHSIP